MNEEPTPSPTLREYLRARQELDRQTAERERLYAELKVLKAKKAALKKGRKP